MMFRDMRKATRLTRAGLLAEATALLQRALRGGGAPEDGSPPAGDAGGAAAAHNAGRIDVAPETIAAADPHPSVAPGPAFGRAFSGPFAAAPDGWVGPHLPKAFRGVFERLKEGRLDGLHGWTGRPPAPDAVPDSGGQLVTRSFSNGAGSRDYKLYIPRGDRGQPLPLIVMLHGCTQSPDDFAAGTRMNALAEEHTCLVAYPAQAASANASKCWN